MFAGDAEVVIAGVSLETDAAPFQGLDAPAKTVIGCREDDTLTHPADMRCSEGWILPGRSVYWRDRAVSSSHWRWRQEYSLRSGTNTMNRRELLGLTPRFLLLTLLGSKACSWPTPGRLRSSLFFDPEDIGHIRENARSPLLKDIFEEWLRQPDEQSLEILLRPMETGDMVSDLGKSFRKMDELSIVYLVTEDTAKAELLLKGIEAALSLPKWDWFMDGEAEIGIMRASQAVGSLLFAMETLGERLPETQREDIFKAIAEKGVAPCSRAIRGMDNPDRVRGWHADERTRERYPYDMSRWPTIFGGINLRAVPTMGLGLGALALDGRDDRAKEWLERSVASAKTYLAQHKPDGSYWEGISYVNYAFSTLFVFLKAYDRVRGDVNWMEYANFKGINAYVAAMQLGRQDESGDPDVVNFSDARTSTSVAVNAWLAEQTADPLAQYNVEHFSQKGYFADFLWYKADLPSAPPPAHLQNVRLDLDWIIARTGWDENDAVLAFRSGKPANHEHADRNSFIYKIHGERLLTDQFGASYDPRLPHWLLRQTEAHNAVLVDGHGHQYVDGSEGTNAGKASASVLRYEDMGDTLWWVSDATQGYRITDNNIGVVRRSILFMKPDWIVVYDELETETSPSRFAARFFPDNRDDHALISIRGRAFSLRRPQVRLNAWTASNVSSLLAKSTLPLPQSYGKFPYVELRSVASQRVELISVLHAAGAEEALAEDPVMISRRDSHWQIKTPSRTLAIVAEDKLPAFALD